jgi:hypothetical protein
VLENRGEVGSFERFSKKHPNFLIGYFQDYAVSLELRNRLDLLHPVRSEENMVSLGDFLELKRAIGVHVRRGDYVNHPTFGLLSRQYFRNALLSIEDSLRPIFIFSDSKVDLRDFVPEHLLQMSQVCQESFSATQVLYLMSRCSDLILSNSSLSWWGGWLATQRGSQVFAPHPWFLNEIQSSNFYPPEWFKLQSNFVTECDN